RGVQLRAAMRGADAVVGVVRGKGPDQGRGARHVSGLAVRVGGGAARGKLRRPWDAEGGRALGNRSLRRLCLLAGALLAVNLFCAGLTRFHAATGETLPQALASAGVALGLAFAWPLLFLFLLRVLRWPQLLRTAGVVVLAATTGRMLAVWLGHWL